MSYKLIAHFPVSVPVDYQHQVRLRKFLQASSREWAVINPLITDERCASPSRVLRPGEGLWASAFECLEGFSLQQSLFFLERVQALRTGAQGLTVLWEQGSGQLPMGYDYFSVDHQARLPKDLEGRHRVPCIPEYRDGTKGFDLGPVIYGSSDKKALACLSELPTFD